MIRETTPEEHIIKMMGGQLVKNKCPDYYIWKFPNELEEIKKLRLPDSEIEKIAKLTGPTWRNINFIGDFNKLMLVVKCAKHLWLQAHLHRQDLGTVPVEFKEKDPFEDFGRADMEIDFALRTVNPNKIFEALAAFAKVYNENKTKIFENTRTAH